MAERHVPVVGLVQVVVEPDDAAGHPVAAVGLDHLPAAGEPLAAVGLHEVPAVVAEERGLDDVDAVDQFGGGDSGHGVTGAFAGWGYSRSIEQWSPIIRRVAEGRWPVRCTWVSRPMSESVSRGTPEMTARSRITECSTSESVIDAVGGDGGERADVGAFHPGSGADDGRPADVGLDDHGTLLHHDAAVDGGGLVDLAVDPGLERLEHPPVGLEQRVLLAGVEPPALEDVVADPVAVVDQPLDGVGDLQLAPR